MSPPRRRPAPEVTIGIERPLHERLAARAGALGLSLPRYVAGVLAAAAWDERPQAVCRDCGRVAAVEPADLAAEANVWQCGDCAEIERQIEQDRPAGG